MDEVQLAQRIELLLERMKPHEQRFAEARAEGATKPAAARAARISAKGGAPWRIAARPDVIELEALLREQARRRAVVTVQGQIQRFQRLARVAEEAGEVGGAITAEREVGRLAGLYPKDSPTIVGGAPVQIIVHTGLPAREGQTVLVSPALPFEERALPRHFEPAVVPGDRGSPVPQQKAGDCSSQDRESESQTEVARPLTAEELLS